jgi:hypothetical protein
MEEIKDSFLYPPYFELWQKYQKIDDLLEILHYAKIANEEINEEQREYGIYTLSEFIDEFNKEYSSLLGIKINLSFSSNKWNRIYKNKDPYLITFMGFEQ